jgi:hypothetical protein
MNRTNALALGVVLVLCLAASEEAPAAEAGGPEKPADKAPEAAPEKPPAAERDVPEPPLPDLVDVPPGLEPGSWRSWATDQEVENLRRINLSIGFTFYDFLSTQAGQGLNAPGFDDIYSSNLSVSLQAGYALMPVVNVGLEFRFFFLDSGEYYFEEGGSNYKAWFDYEDLFFFGLRIRVKLPLLVWTLSSRHLRFSRAEEIMGFVLHLKGAAGIAMLPDIWVDIERDGNSFVHGQQYYRSSTNFAWSAGAAVEYRWSWGGVLAGVEMYRLGRPESAWPPNSDSDDMAALAFTLGFGVHFL